MNYRYIGPLRIPEYKWCGIVTGHKPKGKPEHLIDSNGQGVLVETCSLCGAQRVIPSSPHIPLQMPLVQIRL